MGRHFKPQSNNPAPTNGGRHFEPQSNYSTSTNGGRHFNKQPNTYKWGHFKPQLNYQAPINKERHFEPQLGNLTSTNGGRHFKPQDTDPNDPTKIAYITREGDTSNPPHLETNNSVEALNKYSQQTPAEEDEVLKQLQKT